MVKRKLWLLTALLLAVALTGAALAEELQATPSDLGQGAVLAEEVPATPTDLRQGTSLTADEYQNIVGTYSIDATVLSYEDYLGQAPENRPDTVITVDAADFVRYEDAGVAMDPVLLDDFSGMEGSALLTGEESLVEWVVDVQESGLYDLSVLYYPYEGKNSAIQRAFFIDGKLPYSELALVEFTRVWHNGDFVETVDANGVTIRQWEHDNQGNDLKPSAKEIPEWIDGAIHDSNGYITEQLSVYLEAGEHVLTMFALREPMLVRSITLRNADRPAPYAEVKAAGDAAGYKDAMSGISVRFEAENADKTSSQMLYPVQDQSSPAVYPSSARYLLNNAIGGNSWKDAGQWIEWSFEVPQDGYYALSMYDRQNFVRGIDVYRKIYIDGEVPFAEFGAYAFPYGQNWRLETMSVDGEPARFYLTAGIHTLRMEVVLGDMAEIIAQVQDCVKQLNNIYRQVIYITGVAPDKYRDYQLTASLPGLENALRQVDGDLMVALNAMESIAGSNSDKLTVLRTMHDQLVELIADQERFTEVITSYKINVRACGNWITQVLGMPLQIDRLYIHSADTVPRVENSGWFDSVKHEMERLYYSFIIDYNQVGNVAREDDGDSAVLTLWIGTGRDQANVIKSLIDESFTPVSGIAVNVQLVDMNTLLRATLAGQGPDVAIQVANTNGIAGAVLNTGNDTPVNYGLRHAVLDLTQFDDFDEVVQRFDDSALVPFSFAGATYALPDTQTFPMMFYRKDILAEIGLEVPQTWDDVKVAMSVLAKNQMEFGMLPSEQIFAMLLFQAGGEYYTPSGDASALDSDVAVNVFRRYCEYYTDYKLDKATSVEERFRTGECPIIISDYTTYNNLQVSAPDILGLWDFTQVPGTVREDGTVSRATGASGLADIIMSATKNPQECWEFLKWWTSTETQTAYGREMESLMGASARVATANKEALANLAWPVRDYRELIAQMNEVVGIPQVPGGYYTWRNVNNAFYTVTEDQANQVHKNASTTPREELTNKVLYINAEITYKRQEFDLPTAEEAK